MINNVGQVISGVVKNNNNKINCVPPTPDIPAFDTMKAKTNNDSKFNIKPRHKKNKPLPPDKSFLQNNNNGKLMIGLNNINTAMMTYSFVGGF